ncbi:MAG: glycosyltransferase family 39 protein [Myxococcota bacterium]
MRALAERRQISALVAALALLSVAGAPARAGEPVADPSCADAQGRIPIVEPGRDRDLRALFSPQVAGEALPGVPGALFRSLTVSGSSIVARLETAAGDVDLRLRPLSCASESQARTASFVVDTPAGPPPAAAQAAVDAMMSALRANDDGSFWKASVAAPQAAPAAVPGAPASATTAPQGPPPFHRSVGAIALLLLLAALATLVDAIRARRDAQAPPIEANHLLAALGLAVLAFAIRAAVGPTFIREAYPIPDVSWLLDGARLDSPIAAYPQAPQLIAAWLAPLTRIYHSGDPIGAWMTTHMLLGALTVIVAWVAGRALAGPTVGLVAAAFTAFWPQHIRLSASESTHVLFVFAALLAFAQAMRAARAPRLTATAAALTCAAALVTTRPEAALMGPPLAIAALFHGPELRRRLFHPAMIGLIALLAWLVVPTLLIIAADKSAAALTSPAAGEQASMWAEGLRALVLPGARNALLDFATTPPWLYPLTLIGFATALRHGPRAAGLALGLSFVVYLFFFAPWPASVVLWPYARYHAPLLVGAVLLSALAFTRLAALVPILARPTHTVWAAFAIAGLGCALYLPAIGAIDHDWQQNIAWQRSLGLTRGAELSQGRLILPDNRRRFRDLSPRDAVVALTAGRQASEAAVTVAHALEHLHVDGDETVAWFVEDLTCRLARAPSEPANPQCEAMHRAFELSAESEAQLTGPAWLVDYVALRGPDPVPLRLWRVGRRLLPPAAALALLPPPLPPGSASLDGPIFYPMGSSSPTFTDPPEPPLGDAMEPALHRPF